MVLQPVQDVVRIVRGEAWLAVTPGAPIPLAEGARALRVEESGSVPVLRVLNDHDVAVLLSGDVVMRGGLQTRAVERSCVVPARTAVEVPVRCVEKGRWSPLGGEQRMHASETTGVRMRTTLAQRRSQSVTRGGGYTADQHEVWNTVDQELTRTGTVSGTSSYAAYMDGAREAQVKRARAARVAIPERANAAVIFPRAGGFWLEALPDRDALTSRSEALLAELFDEAPGPDRHERGTRVDEVHSLVAWLWMRALEPVAPVEGTLGRSYAVVAEGAGGQLLMIDRALAHAAIGGS
jgi:hypothetical protein